MDLRWLMTVLAVSFGVIPDVSLAKPTNFLVILCDDLGYGDLGCYGHPQIRTPHLDRLASEGLRFTDFYAAAPVCSPSRAGLLTGRIPNRMGIYDWIPQNSPMHLKSSEITMATLLKSAGYQTCHVGKWHCNGIFNSSEQPQPGDHGFDHWFATQNNASPSHQDPGNFVRNGERVGKLTGYSSSLIVQEGIDWLQRRDSTRPFLMTVWFHTPHEPVATGHAFVAPYREAAKTEEQAEYFGNVTQMDHEVGRLLQALDEQHLREQTLVVFSSDNGPETLARYRGAERSYGTPGKLRGMKLHLYEGGIRVPGIIRWPGRIAPGRISGIPVASYDLLPTLCGIAGVSTPADRTLDGTNLTPLFDGKDLARSRPLYWQYDRAIGGNRIALRDGDWKLLSDATATRFELYNLREDPGETRERSDLEPDRLAALSARLKSIMKEVHAEAPVWPDGPGIRPAR